MLLDNKIVCDPKCYTKGKGCILSEDGRCLHIFKNGKKSQPYRSEKTYYTSTKGRVKTADIIVSSKIFYEMFERVINVISKTKNRI